MRHGLLRSPAILDWQRNHSTTQAAGFQSGEGPGRTERTCDGPPHPIRFPAEPYEISHATSESAGRRAPNPACSCEDLNLLHRNRTLETRQGDRFASRESGIGRA